MSAENEKGGHGHGHGHGTGRAFGIGIGVNVAFVLVEVVAGLLADSVALISDAAHNLGDVLGLVLAWGAAVLARRAPSPRRTYGLRRTTILAALANAVLLLVGVGGVSWEAALRLRSGGEPEGVTMLVVAGAGVIVNAGSALLFARGRHADANVRGAFLHLAADAAVSLGVVVAGAAIVLTGAAWIDPVVSLAVSAVILVTTWGLLRDATDLALDAVPRGIDPDAVRAELLAAAGVTAVHDLHIWAMSTTEVAMTAHVVVDESRFALSSLSELTRRIEAAHGIHHATIQVESADCAPPCGRTATGAI